MTGRRVVLVDDSLIRTLKIEYIVFALMGAAGVVAYPPTLVKLTSDVFITIWVGALMIAGALAFTAISRGWHMVELWAVSAVCLALATYAAGFAIRAEQGDKLFFVLAVGTIDLMLTPCWRMGFLWLTRKHRSVLQGRE